MYKDAYPAHKNTIQISVVQIMMVVAILLVSFVLPAELMLKYRASQNAVVYTQQAIDLQQARVAGASTTADGAVIINIFGNQIDFNSESGMLMAGVLLFGGVAAIITIYLLITPRKGSNRKWK